MSDTYFVASAISGRNYTEKAASNIRVIAGSTCLLQSRVWSRTFLSLQNYYTSHLNHILQKDVKKYECLRVFKFQQLCTVNKGSVPNDRKLQPPGDAYSLTDHSFVPGSVAMT